MGAKVVQDSDAESSDASPEKPRYTTTSLAGNKHGATTGYVHVVDNSNDDGGLQGLDSNPALTQANNGADDEDEVVFVRPRKRQRRDRPAGLSEEATKQLVSSGPPASTSDNDEAQISLDPTSQANSITLSQAANFGLEQLASQEDNKIPRAPILRNISFSSRHSTVIGHSDSQANSTAIDGKMFPSLDSQIIGTQEESETITVIAQEPSSHPRAAMEAPLHADLQADLDTDRQSNTAVLLPPVSHRDAEEPDELSGPQLLAEQATEPTTTRQSKKKRGRPRKQAAIEAEPTDAIEAQERDDAIGTDVVPPQAGKKRGRKRKERVSDPKIDTVNDDSTEHQEEHQAEQTDRRNDKAVSVSVEVPMKAAMEDSINVKNHNEDLNSADLKNDEENKENVPQPVIPKDGSVRNTTKNHSPSRSGWPPVRVGLSKRARIEPLLRIIKK